MNTDLFDSAQDSDVAGKNSSAVFMPLAARMRPDCFAEYFGQRHILSPGKPLYESAHNQLMHSMILWGVPGVGKTTLAQMLAKISGYRFRAVSAVQSGVNDIRKAVEWAQKEKMHGLRCVLFVDEVHRFNKAQQDAFLPHIENGTFTFVGATTENPSFSLNNALLSRARVYLLKPLDESALSGLLHRALEDKERGLGSFDITLTEEAEKCLIQAADGDARRLLNMLEIAFDFACDGVIDQKTVAEIITGEGNRFDRGGDIFHDQLSAFHKSLRGSKPDAALYWFARMVQSGTDPVVLLRRLTAMASEDIGNADPRALEMVLNAWNAWERLGAPEGFLSVSQAIIYCSCAPKSNAVYKAMSAAFEDAKADVSHEVPLHLRNAPTGLMKSIGCKQSYRYAHDEPEAYAAGQNYFPHTLGERKYYYPVDRGLEIKLAQKLQWLESLDQIAAQRKERMIKPELNVKG